MSWVADLRAIAAVFNIQSGSFVHTTVSVSLMKYKVI